MTSANLGKVTFDGIDREVSIKLPLSNVIVDQKQRKHIGEAREVGLHEFRLPVFIPDF